MGGRWGTWQEARTGEVCSGQLDLLLDPFGFLLLLLGFLLFYDFFLLFWVFLFFILSFDSLGFFEVGRVLATAFSLLIRVRELFLAGNSFVRRTDWEAMWNVGETAGGELYLRVCARCFPVCPLRDTKGRGDHEEGEETQGVPKLFQVLALGFPNRWVA